MVTPYSVFMAKGFSIAEFTSDVLKRSGGISASNLYSFSIASPTNQDGYNLNKHFARNLDVSTGLEKDKLVNRQLNMLCNEIQIPGVTMSAADYKMGKKGIIQKLASAKVYNELDVSFYCDADSLPFKFFRCWQDYIIAPIEAPAEFYSAKHTMYDGYHHEVYAQRYYDQYTCDIIINKLEKYGVPEVPKGKEKIDHNLGFRVKLAKAYPYTVSSIPYSAGPANLVKVTVGFYYEYSHFVAELQPKKTYNDVQNDIRNS